MDDTTEVVLKALDALIREENLREQANPYGPWADDSRELLAKARRIHEDLRMSRLVVQ